MLLSDHRFKDYKDFATSQENYFTDMFFYFTDYNHAEPSVSSVVCSFRYRIIIRVICVICVICGSYFYLREVEFISNYRDAQPLSFFS